MGGILLGFGLNELSTFIKVRREDRRIVGRALAELLEVRFQLLFHRGVVKEIIKLLPVKISAYDELMIQTHLVPKLLPNPAEGLTQRYNDAVTAVSGVLPTLAYVLRSKDLAASVLERMQTIVPVPPEAAPYVINLQDKAIEVGVSKLDELIRELAKLHGRKSAKEVEPILRGQTEIPADVIKFVADQALAAKAAEEAQRKATSAQQGNTTASDTAQSQPKTS